MTISFIDALTRAWNRMVDMLFRPFDVGKWVVLGFSAWLAYLTTGTGSGGGTGFSGDSVLDDTENLGRDVASAGRVTEDGLAQIGALWQQAWDWLTLHSWILVGLVTLCVFLVIVVILLTWISSRARFIFLDNVVEDRAWIKEPWSRLASLGDSLFAFRVGFGLLNLVIALVFLGAVGTLVWSMVAHRDVTGVSAGLWITAAIAFLAMLLYGLIVTYIDFFLGAFVVPIMYRTGATVIPAWRAFSALFRQRWGTLLLSGLFSAFLHLIAWSAIVIVGFLTCCIGFIAVATPYIGTLILLPLIVTYRLFTVELLGDLDSNLDLLAEPSALSEPNPAI